MIIDLYNDYVKQTDNPLAFETFKIRLRKWQSPYRQREWKTWFTHKAKEEKKEYFREKMREFRKAKVNWNLYNIRISRYWPTEKEIFTEEDFKYIKSIPNYELTKFIT